MQLDPEGVPGESRGSYLHRWRLWLRNLLQDAGDDMRQVQQKYQHSFGVKARPTMDQLKKGSFGFVRRAHSHQEQTTHKLSLTALGPYEVASLNASTMAAEDGLNFERASRDRIAQSSFTTSGTPFKLSDAS